MFSLILIHVVGITAVVKRCSIHFKLPRQPETWGFLVVLEISDWFKHVHVGIAQAAGRHLTSHSQLYVVSLILSKMLLLVLRTMRTQQDPANQCLIMSTIFVKILISIATRRHVIFVSGDDEYHLLFIFAASVGMSMIELISRATRVRCPLPPAPCIGVGGGLGCELLCLLPHIRRRSLFAWLSLEAFQARYGNATAIASIAADFKT